MKESNNGRGIVSNTCMRVADVLYAEMMHHRSARNVVGTPSCRNSERIGSGNAVIDAQMDVQQLGREFEEMTRRVLEL